MSRTLQSGRHKALTEFLIERRKKAGLTQAEVAKKLRRYQSFVATVESGQRKIDVVELLAFAEAIDFDPRDAIKRLSSIKADWRIVVILQTSNMAGWSEPAGDHRKTGRVSGRWERSQRNVSTDNIARIAKGLRVQSRKLPKHEWPRTIGSFSEFKDHLITAHVLLYRFVTRAQVCHSLI
jgi:transcriptional regulator with XRE-family HTH domain